MPITPLRPLTPVDQEAFAAIAYEVLEVAFEIHRDMGRLFEEPVYQQELANRIPRSQIEFPIDIAFEDFQTQYFIDLLVGSGGVFELKTVERLSQRHRSQLLHYLLLTDVRHGKLVNFRPERVEHEFVNTNLNRADRTNFAVDTTQWRDLDWNNRELRAWLEAALRDWGAGLDLALYQHAVIHFFGGQENAPTLIEVVRNGRRLSLQKAISAGANAIVTITTLPLAKRQDYENHARKFLQHTTLAAMQWININRTQVAFKTLERQAP